MHEGALDTNHALAVAVSRPSKFSISTRVTVSAYIKYNTPELPALRPETHEHNPSQKYTPAVNMAAVLESPKPRINCSMLSQYISKAVCLVGRVDKVSDAK